MNESGEHQGWVYQQQQPPPAVPMDQYNNYSPYSPPADNKTGFHQFQPEAYSQPVEPDADMGDVVARQLLKEQLKMAVFAALSLVILIFNVAVLGAYARSVGSPSPAIPVFWGTCAETARFGLWVHLLINALALSLALASANGMRNVRLVREGQSYGSGGSVGGGAILFFFVASLLPIYVLYNAAIYQIVGANAYYAAAVGEDFSSAGPALPAALANSNFSGFDAAYDNMLANGSSWVRMDNLECIKTYSAVFLSDYRNVILVVSNSSSPAALYQAFYIDWRSFLALYPQPGVSSDIYTWMCPPDAWIGNQECNNSVCYYIPPQTCTASGLESNATAWTVPLSEIASIYDSDMPTSPIEYCLAEPSASQCSIGLNWYFLLVVAVCNAVKLICQLLSLRLLRRTGRMLTVGDERHRAYERRPTRWIQAYRWHGIIWLLCVILPLVGVALSQALLAEKNADQSIDITSLWNRGFGTVSLDSTLNALGLGLGQTAGSGAILRASLLANAPQLIITLLFFNFTYALTVMEAHSKYAKPHLTAAQLAKPARDLPLYYAIVAGVIQFVVHWMASQAFFPIIVQTSTSEFYDFGPIGIGSLGDGGLYVTAGFSPIAIIFTLISLMVAFCLLLGVGYLRKYRWN